MVAASNLRGLRVSKIPGESYCTWYEFDTFRRTAVQADIVINFQQPASSRVIITNMASSESRRSSRQVLASSMSSCCIPVIIDWLCNNGDKLLLNGHNLSCSVALSLSATLSLIVDPGSVFTASLCSTWMGVKIAQHIKTTNVLLILNTHMGFANPHLLIFKILAHLSS